MYMEKKMDKRKSAPEPETPQPRPWRPWMSRILAGVVGLVLLTSGLSKATDMALFVRQMRDYGFAFHHLLLGAGAWGLIAVEWSLGVALLISYRLRLTLSLTIVLFLIFLGASSWAVFTGATEECGCFGAWLERTPKQAVIEDVILTAATVLALLVYKPGTSPQRRSKPWVVAAACLTGLALPAFFGPSLAWMKQPLSAKDYHPLSILQIPGKEPIDLRRGSYLIILMDANCLHCRKTIPELNELAKADDLPMVIGLCMNEEKQKRSFIEEFQPNFPIGQIGEDAFWRLLGEGELPRIILFRDRRILKVWDKAVPDENAIRAARSGS